jgi:hypothetical protein
MATTGRAAEPLVAATPSRRMPCTAAAEVIAVVLVTRLTQGHIGGRKSLSADDR